MKEEETVPETRAPVGWDWVFYTINHFKPSTFLTKELNYSTKAEKYPDIVPDYDWNHNNRSTDVLGWQDEFFLWMSEVEDATFEHPGPASGRRGEWAAFNL